jgi:predicted N-formylglutamate amidohydrolase
MGILYDPKRRCETVLAKALQKNVRDSSGLRIRRNYPYYGYSDGFTTALRKIHSERRYLGLEIEINQAVLSGRRSRAPWLADLLYRSLKEILEP